MGDFSNGSKIGLVGHAQQRGFRREKAGGTVMREAQWACKPPAGHRVRLSGSLPGLGLGPFCSQTGAPEGPSKRD